MQTNETRELGGEELDQVAGGFNIGPIHIGYSRGSGGSISAIRASISARTAVAGTPALGGASSNSIRLLPFGRLNRMARPASAGLSILA